MNLLLHEEVQQLTEMQKQRKLFTANKSNICYLILLRNGHVSELWILYFE